MNSSNLFGKQQGGAFQAPNNANRSTGLFQSFGQPGASSAPQNVPFGQTATFGQTSAFSQTSGFGQGAGQTSIFGQTPAFGQSSVFGQNTGLGQSSGQASAFLPSSMNQTSAFGQPALGQSSSGFGAPPSYAQSTGQSQSLVFGQAPAFGQTSAFGQSSGFSQQTPGFGLSSSISQASSGSTAGSGPGQSITFGQSFGQSSAFSLPAATSGSSLGTQSVVQSRGFGTSEFSFKPSDEAVFKPIFSVSPEPANSQPAPGSEPFGSAPPPSTSMESSGPAPSGFSLMTGDTPSALGFSFSQPAAAPSISVPSTGLPHKDLLPGTTSSASGKPEFTFSQPAAPSNSGASLSQPATVPSSPSSFSFSAKVLQPPVGPPMSLFGVGSFGQTSAFGDPKAKVEPAPGTVEKGGDEESSGEAAFGTLGKGIKRKEEPAEQTAAQGSPAKAEEPQTEGDTPRHPPKRPLLRSRGPAGGLFRNAMSSLMRSSAHPVKKEPKKEESPPEWGEAEKADPVPQTTHTPATPPRAPAPTREFIEKEEETATDPEAKTPARHSRRGESTDSLGGTSPADATAIQCKNVPAHLNKKDVIEKHFSRFGKVSKVFCRPNKSLAIVHFHDHASAAKAKKKGKSLHRHEIVIFWQRKKQSPGEKGERPPEGKELEVEPEDSGGGGFQSSPLRKPLPRSPAISSSATLAKGAPIKKSTIMKSLQFDSEPQPEPSSEGQGSDRPAASLPSSLLHLVGQVAETAEEKYRLLEQRDKILRQGRPKRTDLDMSKVFVGTCPDMCPEKERYMRETRNQLSSYEVIPDTEKVDHAAAIKEYSRSSADQEEPLPHELRPLPVLSMTMDYLVTQIMDQGEDNYRDWYDFVWNRTRGIRKDITQQHLCDPLTVSLIEKCTRFHIHCAHHLCQEPMMSFDAKINNENMTKCLQSLKEMYQDLATREVYCPREAEFRQYNVLLKLNDGDILREVQQFREAVRNSPEVKFAVQAFAALNNNNFVRFFKLVRAATYLAGCILHRYFNQVRREALRALNVAYTVGSHRSTSFPVDDLVRMLMFRSVGEATDFAQQYGLTVCDGIVELNRTAFQDPDLPVPLRKSVDIMGKRTVLIGEVVNGGPLPNPPQHTPVCSFDSRHKYRGEGPLTDPTALQRGAPLGAVPQKPEARPQTELRPLMDLEVRPPIKSKPVPELKGLEDPGELPEQVATSDPQQLFQSIAPPQPTRPPSPPPKPEPVYTDQDITAQVESVVEEVLEAECSELASTAAEYVSTALGMSDGQVEALVSEVLEQMLKEVSAAEIQAEKERIAEEKRKMEEARRKQEHEAFLAQFSESLCSEISQEVLTECIRDTAASEIEHAQKEKAACVARSSEEVCDSLVEETLQAEISELARGVLEVELQRIRKFLKRWRDVVAVRRQLKRQMRGFPAAPCCVDPRFKLKALVPSAPSSPCLDQLARGVVNLGNAGNMAVSCTRLLKMRQEAIHQMRVQHYYQLLLSESVWTPLDLPTLVVENVSNPTNRIFWKAALLLPSNQESDMNISNRILTEWLEAKFSGEEKSCDPGAEPDGKMLTLSISNGLRSLGSRTHKVHVCIKVTRGPLSEEGQCLLEKQKEVLGTGGLLLLLPSAPGSGDDRDAEAEEVLLLSALLQLRQLQQASAGMPALPLVVVVPEPSERPISDEKLEGDLRLQTLVEDGVISEYMFVHIPETTNDLQVSEQVTQAVRWLVARSPAPADLTSQTLVQFVEGGLCREFSARLYQDRRDREGAGLPCQEPAPVIHLYNSVLGFLADLVSSDRLSGLSWPVAEFSVPETRDLLPHLDWNSPEHLAWLRRAVLSLQIPEWDLPPTSAPWPRLCSSIFQYASQIPSSRHSQPLLMSRLENLLGRVLSHYRQGVAVAPDDSEDEEEGKGGPSFSQVPWDEIVALCIDHRLKDWQPPESPAAEDAVMEDGEILVYFQKERLKDFEPPPSWTEAVNRTHREKQQEADGSTPSLGRGLPPTPAPLRLRQKLFHSMGESLETPAALDITHTPSPKDLLPQRVLAGLEEEKAQSQRFEEQLQRWLEKDPLESFSMPAFMPSSLISVPEMMAPTPKTATANTTLAQQADNDTHGDKLDSNWLRSAPMSVAQRLKELDRLILASRGEELACGLHLNSLLDIVED
ncbi:germinal-center associated nuclear protein [Megalops cyprinoides]|uniref:germinal-center associated nuclear protein n=1 Tax=Megalops cyprinoides TaxID=118141 RepID=UPI001863B1FD|nr:germinal-center associated nuclear protein [Megalops cyprinoides]XP_036400727.1 germinal-center associated nuclear protein [Megalops cyprinoides]XP_036400728.1 germinal-center associated nuclear protein [Megalops cyprinoides]